MKMLLCDIIFPLSYDPAYKPRTHQSSWLCKPNAHILGHVTTVKQLDLIGWYIPFKKSYKEK